MSYRVLLHPKAPAFLRNSEEDVAQRIEERLKELCEEPARKGERLRHSTYYRLRIGDYRAIYMLEEGEHKVIVLFIGHKRDVYDDFSRLV